VIEDQPQFAARLATDLPPALSPVRIPVLPVQGPKDVRGRFGPSCFTLRLNAEEMLHSHSVHGTWPSHVGQDALVSTEGPSFVITRHFVTFNGTELRMPEQVTKPVQQDAPCNARNQALKWHSR